MLCANMLTIIIQFFSVSHWIEIEKIYSSESLHNLVYLCGKIYAKLYKGIEESYFMDLFSYNSIIHWS